MRLAGPASDSASAVGGMEPLILHRDAAARVARPEFMEVLLLPGRGMNVFQARARLPGHGDVPLLASPPLDDARRRMTGSGDDWMGVQSFSCGGALLVPFANRIRGRLLPDGRTIETTILGQTVRLPADWHGPQPGAAKCAMHGLILDAPMQVTNRTADQVEAVLDAGDFDGHWLSRTELRVSARLRPSAFELSVTCRNVGVGELPVGVGWHPYFAVPSGRRDQVRIHLPARQRALVTNYDDVFPTGEIEPVTGTPYDFHSGDGAALGSHYFDDSFVDLERTPDGHVAIELVDPAGQYRMRLTALSPHVRAVQLYSRPDKPFVVLEPQFNYADPFSPVWPPRVDTGMVVVQPGADVTWAVRWELLPFEQ